MTRHHPIRDKDTRRSGLRNTAIVSALGIIMAATCAVPPDAAAQPAKGGDQLCPRGYELIDLRPAYCTNSSGDVVEPVTSHRSTHAVGCRQGYFRLEGLCLSPATGDVELAETPASTQASR